MLLYCVQNINRLIHSDKVGYMASRSFEERQRLFLNVTSILEVSQIFYKAATYSIASKPSTQKKKPKDARLS